MSVDGETLSAITGMEEACATARARVEDLVAEVDDLRRCLRSVIAQRDEAQAKIAGLPAWQKGCEQALADLADAEEAIARLYTERDEALAEVDGLRLQIERLRGVLHIVSLDEYESTSSAAEKVHAHARQARVVLNETLAEITPSDAAHVASLENLFLKACKRAEKWETASKDAYRRGAEAMREACAREASVCANHRGEELDAIMSALPIPEEP